MSTETMEYFSQFQTLSPILDSTNYEIVPVWARIQKPGGEDGFFANTLGNESTIPHCIMLRLKAPTPLPERYQGSSGGARSAGESAPQPPDTIMILELSRPGVCSHPSTAHGGVVSTILDEAMSHTLLSHFPTEPATVDNTRMTLFTSKLEIAFKRPVRVPGVLIVKGWCVETNGRKYWMKALAVQYEQTRDGIEEVIKSEGSGVWVKVDSKM